MISISSQSPALATKQDLTLQSPSPPLLNLHLDHPHRRVAAIDRLVGHIGGAEAGGAALEVERLGCAVGVGEGQAAVVERDADVRQLVRVHAGLHVAGGEDRFLDADELVLEQDAAAALHRCGRGLRRHGGGAGDAEGEAARRGQDRVACHVCVPLR